MAKSIRAVQVRSDVICSVNMTQPTHSNNEIDMFIVDKYVPLKH